MRAEVLTCVRRKLPCPYGRVVGSPRWAAGVPGEPRGHISGCHLSQTSEKMGGARGADAQYR
eukprot:1178975-Prorocentrum_minimum.AAC.1